MALRLVLNYENATHRFLKNAQVTLTLGQNVQPVASSSKQGAHVWDLPGAADGQKYILKILIDAPPNSGPDVLFKLEQPLELKSDPATGFRFNPTNGDGHWQSVFNPRLTGQWVKAGAGQRFEINADLTFLDVTDYFQRFMHDPANAGKKNVGLDLYNSLKPTNPIDQAIGLRPSPDPPMHYNTRLRLMEFTGGQAVTWGVVIPELVTTTSKLIGALMFYRPAMADLYTNTDDLQIRDMLRYLSDPTPEETPFFARDPDVKVKGQSHKWDPFPQCSWEKQIHKSGKCFVFVHPFPHGSAYGHAAGGRVPALLASLVKALWADQTIAPDVLTDLKLDKIGLSGFSRGSDALYQALKSNPAKVKELYLFDPLKTLAHQADILSWFNQGGRKLRMMGGVYAYDAMLSIAAALKSADASLRPSSKAEWSAIGSQFTTAVMPVKGGKRRTLLLLGDTQTDTFQRELSDESKIFFVRDDGNGGAVIEGVPAVGKPVRRTVPDCTREEIAALLNLMLDVARFGRLTVKPETAPNGQLMPAGMIEFHGNFFKPEFVPKVPVKSEADVDHNVGAFIQATKDVRHQWAVVGGDDFTSFSTNRGAGFVGYLEDALKKSSFS